MKDCYRLRYYTVSVFEAFAADKRTCIKLCMAITVYITLTSGIIISCMLCHALHSKF